MNHSDAMFFVGQKKSSRNATSLPQLTDQPTNQPTNQASSFDGWHGPQRAVSMSRLGSFEGGEAGSLPFTYLYEVEILPLHDEGRLLPSTHQLHTTLRAIRGGKRVLFHSWGFSCVQWFPYSKYYVNTARMILSTKNPAPLPQAQTIYYTLQ